MDHLDKAAASLAPAAHLLGMSLLADLSDDAPILLAAEGRQFTLRWNFVVASAAVSGALSHLTAIVSHDRFIQLYSVPFDRERCEYAQDASTDSISSFENDFWEYWFIHGEEAADDCRSFVHRVRSETAMPLLKLPDAFLAFGSWVLLNLLLEDLDLMRETELAGKIGAAVLVPFRDWWSQPGTA